MHFFALLIPLFSFDFLDVSRLPHLVYDLDESSMLWSTSGFKNSFQPDGLTSHPHRWPNLFLVDDGDHFLMNCFDSWFLMNFSHLFIHSQSLLDHVSTSGGWGSTMWATPLLIRNLNSKVAMVQRKILGSSLWKLILMLSKEALLSIACSSQNLSTIWSAHSYKLVLPPFGVCASTVNFCIVVVGSWTCFQ